MNEPTRWIQTKRDGVQVELYFDECRKEIQVITREPNGDRLLERLCGKFKLKDLKQFVNNL